MGAFEEGSSSPWPSDGKDKGEGSDPGNAATVRDVAEASGLPESDVAAHLRRIRAESAFAAPIVTRPSALPWIALGALAVGLGVTGWRLYADRPVASLPLSSGTPAIVVRTAFRSARGRPPALQWVGGPGLDRAPAGFRIETVGQRAGRVDQGTGEVRALPYEVVRDRLAASAADLVSRTLADDGTAPAPPGTRYEDLDGAAFSPRPGFVHVSLSGWAGKEAGWVAVPLTGAGRADLSAMAERLLADAKRTQDAALAPVPDPRSGLVLPPPGFATRFAGRRLDVRRGPRVSFAPIAASDVAARLEAAILNAMDRDLRAPLGPWTGDAAQDARIPRPDRSHVEIMEPDGTIAAADVPTRPGDPKAGRIVRDLAARAANGIESTDGGALGKDGRTGL